jgi:hypothetical protein
LGRLITLIALLFLFVTSGVPLTLELRADDPKLAAPDASSEYLPIASPRDLQALAALERLVEFNVLAMGLNPSPSGESLRFFVLLKAY